jgi:hypothetical protein
MIHEGVLPLLYVGICIYESMLCLSSLEIEIAVSRCECVVVGTPRHALKY